MLPRSINSTKFQSLKRAPTQKKVAPRVETAKVVAAQPTTSSLTNAFTGPKSLVTQSTKGNAGVTAGRKIYYSPDER